MSGAICRDLRLEAAIRAYELNGIKRSDIVVAETVGAANWQGGPALFIPCPVAMNPASSLNWSIDGRPLVRDRGSWKNPG